MVFPAIFAKLLFCLSPMSLIYIILSKILYCLTKNVLYKCTMIPF